MVDWRPGWRSLRLRLPLMVSLMIAAALGVFLWLAYRELGELLIARAEERAATVARQIGNQLTQTIARGRAELERRAADPTVRRFLEHGTGADEVTTALGPLLAANQPPLAFFDRNRKLVLEVHAPGQRPDVAPIEYDTSTLGESGVSPFGLLDDTHITYGLTLEVTGADGRLGWIVLRRILTDNQTAAAFEQLVGTGSRVFVGNADGSLWTDLRRPVDEVPADLRPGRTIAPAHDEGHIGAAGPVEGTPWAVWISLPREDVLAPATTMLARMISIALLVTGIGAVVVWNVSRRITGPLSDLTRASEAMAAGDLDTRVEVTRRDEIGRLRAAFNAMAERISEEHRTLEARVDERTAGLQTVNQELEAFSYSVSHDLRAPLRHIAGFSSLLSRSATSLQPAERRYLDTIVEAAQRMGQLIDDLLAFSRVSRLPLTMTSVDLGQVVEEAQREVADDEGPPVEWHIAELPSVEGDRALLRLVMINLLSNALKYSSTRPARRIEIGAERADGEVSIYVRDNGVGFDMEYAPKLFGVFQRLHRPEEFSGTGIGLANVRRIIQRHGGRTWAEGAVDQGATFWFSMPVAAEGGVHEG